MQFENMLIKWIMHNHYLCCLAKHIEPRRAATKPPVGQGQAGQGPWTEMSCGRCFAAFLRISCHRCNIPERSLFLEELSMEGGSGGARVLLCVWEHPLQVGVLGCIRVGWKVLFLHWWAERSWLIAGHLSSFYSFLRWVLYPYTVFVAHCLQSLPFPAAGSWDLHCVLSLQPSKPEAPLGRWQREIFGFPYSKISYISSCISCFVFITLCTRLAFLLMLGFHSFYCITQPCPSGPAFA